jgi:hypothetical protein
MTPHKVRRDLWNTEMFGKKNIGRFTGVLTASVYTALISGTVYGFFHRLRLGFLVLIFIALWGGFYLAGNWAAVERSAELERKFPTSSKDLRAKRKAFYDWLASQGRRS